MIALGFLSGAASGARQDPDGSGADTDAGFVSVIEVSGLIDPIVTEFVVDQLADAERDGARALVIQLSANDAVVDDEAIVRFAERLVSASVPVAIWIGPSGARVSGRAAQLTAAVPDVGISPGSRIGATGPSVLPVDLVEHPLFDEASERMIDDTIGYEEAETAGLRRAATLGDFVLDVPGVETETVQRDGQPRRQPVTTVRSTGLSLVDELFHTVASPPVAYLLTLAGMALIIFELYTASIGLAGAVGAGCLLLGFYGLWVLPTRWWAVAVFAIAGVLFAADVQLGARRAVSLLAMALVVVGSLFLYDGASLSWVALLGGIVGMAAFMLIGTPTMVRTRFSTPRIERGWLEGELGQLVMATEPAEAGESGHVSSVRVREALWRARTEAPAEAGELVRVVRARGITLDVDVELGDSPADREAMS